MAKGLIKDSTLTTIANAIREKTETTATMLPSEMAALIQGITGAKMTYGALTLAPKQVLSSLTITHDLGEIPNIIYVCNVSSNIDSGKLIMSLILWPDETGWLGISDLNHIAQKLEISNYITDLTETSMTFNAPTNNYAASTFRGGYYWLVGVV